MIDPDWLPTTVMFPCAKVPAFIASLNVTRIVEFCAMFTAPAVGVVGGETFGGTKSEVATVLNPQA